MSEAGDALHTREGMVLNARYELLEQIGTGGMGEVWRAKDVLLNRPVAVKLLHARHMADTTSRERFRTEGRITAVLSHPGIAQVYDYGEQDNHAFLVMELVPGEPLSEILDRNPSGLAPAVALDIVAQVGRALGAAHAHNVVHRDLKPGNLLVTEDGTVKLTDFGIARGNESLGLTQTGMVMGTAQYISPEQASGQSATASSDLYALGVVAYECLTGAPPFHADSPVALALAHVREPPPPLPQHLPPALRSLVTDLLHKAPAQRPRSTVELLQHVEHVRTSLPSMNGGATASLSVLPRTAPIATQNQDVPTAAQAAVGEDRPGAHRGPAPNTQPNPPVEPADSTQADSARLGRKLNWNPWLVVAIAAAVVVLALGVFLVTQLLNGGGDDGQPESRGPATTEPTVEVTTESNGSAEEDTDTDSREDSGVPQGPEQTGEGEPTSEPTQSTTEPPTDDETSDPPSDEETDDSQDDDPEGEPTDGSDDTGGPETEVGLEQ